MGQKSFSNNVTNSKIHKKTLFGFLDLESTRKGLNPMFTYNTQSLTLFFISIIPFTFSLVSNKVFELSWFFLFIALDLLVVGLILKPITYYKNGVDIAKTNSFSNLMFNSHFEKSETERFIWLLFPRVLIYTLISFLSVNYLSQKDYVLVTVLYLGSWVIIVSLLIIFIIISAILVSIGMTIDDYNKKGTTHSAIQSFRQEISKSALELDKVISSIKSYNNPRFSEENRKRIADLLFKVRNYLVIDDRSDPTFTNDMKIKFVQTEKELSEELLTNLKNDKCVVCYTPLTNSTGQYLVCPICGHGGHKNHVEEWFKTKTTCPSCSSDVSSSNFLLL